MSCYACIDPPQQAYAALQSKAHFTFTHYTCICELLSRSCTRRVKRLGPRDNREQAGSSLGNELRSHISAEHAAGQGSAGQRRYEFNRLHASDVSNMMGQSMQPIIAMHSARAQPASLVRCRPAGHGDGGRTIRTDSNS